MANANENDLLLECEKPAKSLQEKISVLQARDKYIRLHIKKQTNIETAKAVLGTCNDMCPEFERYCREERNLLSTLEMTNGLPDEYKMVKEYRRSGADQEEPLPHELRPPPVLERTMLYLAANIMDLIDNDPSLTGEWFDFLWSRTRAIRKDITQQHLCGLSSVNLLEKCARFHIFCAHKLCEEDMAIFDPKINNENLTKCIQSLKDFYFDLSLKNIKCPNEAEFRCYDILLNLSDGDILREISHFNNEMRKQPFLKFALEVQFAFSNNNFARFFILLKKASYLSACIMHRYIPQVRVQAICLLKRACTLSSQKEYYPKKRLLNQLCFDNEEEMNDFCYSIGLQIEDDSIVLVRSESYSFKNVQGKRSVEYIERKRDGKSIGEIVFGNKINENPFRKYPLTNSFNSEGNLVDELIGKQKIFNSVKDYKSNNNMASNELFNRTQNIFGKPNSNKLTDGQNIRNQSLFSLPAVNKIDFPTQNLFGKTSNGTSTENNFNLFQNSTLNNMQQNTSSLFSKNLFSNQSLFRKPNDRTITSPEPKYETSNLKPKFDEKEITSVAVKLFQPILNEVLSELIKDKFNSYLINEIAVKITNDLFFEVVTEITESLAKSVFTYENAKSKKINQLLTTWSNEIYNKIINHELNSITNEIVKNVYIIEKKKHIDLKSIELFKFILEESVVEVAGKIAKEAYDEAILERKEKIIYMQNKRSWRLAKNSYFAWRKKCLQIRRYRFIKETFPASKIEIISPTLKITNMKRKISLSSLDQEQYDDKDDVLRKTFKLDYESQNISSYSLDENLINKILKEENSITSKLNYIKNSITSMKKIDGVFNSALRIMKPLLDLTESKKKD